MRPREAPAAPLGPRAAETVAIVRQHFGHLSERQHEAILAAVRSKMADRRATRVARGPLRWSVISAGALLACAVGAGSVWRHRGHPEAISFRVEGADLRTGGYVEAGPSSRPVLRFSDGSEVTLGEGSRAHVRTVDEHGARVTLDEGRAHAYVVHAPATRWSFDVGPFVVAVTGTAFGVSWSAVDGQFDLRLENGTVTVSGPAFDTPVALHAGQWLTVRARDVLIRDLGPAGSEAKTDPLGVAPLALDRGSAQAADEPAAAPERALGPHRANADPTAEPSSEALSPRRAERHRSASAARASSHGWAADLAAGRFAAIVDEALRIGLEEAFSGSRGDDLAALADAARYTRHYDVARGALMAERQRFGVSERARVAAFSLGRLSEAQQDDRAALSWFETYLMEAPGGTYASEALGRKMLLVEQLDGNDAARPLAAAYLLAFPNGTYAQAARAVGPALAPRP
jgi:hypothetical protein